MRARRRLEGDKGEEGEEGAAEVDACEEMSSRKTRVARGVATVNAAMQGGKRAPPAAKDDRRVRNLTHKNNNTFYTSDTKVLKKTILGSGNP